jgi:molybdopterin converting factor small subunit
MSSLTGVYVQLPGGTLTADGRRGLECNGATVREVLEEVMERESCIRSRFLAADGHLNVSVFLNGCSVARLGGLDTALRPGDRLSVLPHISGE